MSRKLQILILEDRPADAELAMRELRNAGLQFTAKCVATEADFLAQLRDDPPDVILADYSLPAYDGLSALAAAQKACLETPFIFVSGLLGEETAIKALHLGATDYVLKQRLAHLGPAVQRALREVAERTQRQQAEAGLRASERSYREIFNAASDAIFLHDAATGAVLDVNQAALDLFGYSREELLNLDGDQFRAGGAFSHPEALRRLKRASAESPQVFEWQSKRKNGELFWTEVVLRRANVGGQGRVLAVVRDITERKRAESALAENRGLLKAILDNIPDPAWRKDIQGRFLFCNEPLAQIYGRREQDILGKTVFDTLPAEAERLTREDQQVIATGKPVHVEKPLADARGQKRWFDTFKSPILNERGEVTGTVGIARETTERRQTDRQIQHLNEVLRAIRQVDELIVQERNPERLLAEACNILVQTRGYRFVWIGRPDPESKRVVPAARAGAEAEELDRVTVTWDDTKTGRGPMGTALRTRRTCVCQNIATDPAFAPWRETVQAGGYASVAAAPIIHGDRLFGAIAIYGDSPGAFNDEELGLLSELAGDLAFALQSIESEHERKGAIARLHLLSGALESAANAIVITDRAGVITWVNPAFTELTGYSLPEVLGRRTSLLKSGVHDAAFYRNLWDTVLAGRVWSAEMTNRRKDGTLYTEANTITPVRDEKGEVTHFIAVKQDVTERKQAEEELRSSEERFRSVWEHSIDGMRLTDREGRILAVNAAFCRLVKLPAEKLIGQVFAVAYANHGQDEVEVYRQHFRAGTFPARLTALLRLWNSEELDVEVSSSFVESDGQTKTLLCIFRDVGERKNSDRRIAAFSSLGQKLSAAKTAREAGDIIIEVAQQLLGWDACTLDLYSPELDRTYHVLNRDTINGKIVECGPVHHNAPPSPRSRRAIEVGAHLILKDEPGSMVPDAVPFGDTARPSASAMYVPIRDGSKVTGILSVHSYTPKAYDERSLATLQSLADHCGGALDRIRTQEALLREQEFTRALLENIADGVVACDAAGTLVLLNRTVREWHGMDSLALPPEGWASPYSLHGPDGATPLPPTAVPLTRALHGETIHDVSLTIAAKGQPLRYVLASGSPFFDASKKQLGAVVVVRDITERKRAELRIEAFSKLGQKLSAAKTAREAAEIIIAVADQLLGWDACTLDLYSPELDRLRQVLVRDTINGQRMDCALLGNDAPPPPRARQVIETGGLLVLKDESACMSPDLVPFGDTLRPSASMMFAPVRDGSKVIGILSIHSYTPKAYDQRGLETLQMLADHCAGALKRIGAQEALDESEANYRSLVESSPDAIFLHRDGTFVYANPAALKLLGAEQPQQVLGLGVFDIVPPENRDRIGQRIRQAAEGEMAPPLEQKILRLDGTSLDAEVTSIPFTYEGKPAVQTVMRDITGRKQLEQQLRQSQKMQAIGQLAGGVAHDFNNMLAVIRGNAELLLMDADQHTPQTKEGLKQVIAASERAANLTRQLLAFGRKQVMQSRPLVLNDVIADLTKMLKRIIGEHIDLQCRYAAQLPFVQADAGMIEQVLLNLAVNARDAMPRGGQLLITTDTARFDAAYARTHPEAAAGEFACLTMSDTGTGIAPEHLPRIFEPFFTTKELGKGTGLGLATVYGIVAQHQGWIEVSSQPGAGATFKIFLPTIPTPALAAAAPQAPAELPGGTETILLVEDEYAVRVITRRVLESRGYKIYEATTAREALEIWRSHAEEIALLVTDIIMPQGVTGRDLAEQLRAQRPALKVVFMSGYSADVIGKDTEFFRRTRCSFLQKPISSQALLQTVRRCLDE